MNGEKMWLSGVEMCVFARKPLATFNEFCKVPVWRYPSGTAKRHPTEKPLDLMKRLVAASTNQNDIVLDPCLGSGTTGDAAVSLNRRFVGIEREASYVDIARRRIADAAAQGNLFQEAP
jgi:site-specific DNA-methyltransferase (adenine-specific)